MLLPLLLRALVIVVIASVIRWAIGRAPDSVVSGDFKAILDWIVIVVAVIMLVVIVLRAIGIAIA